MLLQNGVLKVFEEVQAELQQPQWDGFAPDLLIGSMTHGAFTTGPLDVVHAGRGTCTLARVDASLPSLLHPWQQRRWGTLP